VNRDAYLVGTLVLGSSQGFAYQDADESEEDAATEQALVEAVAQAAMLSVPNADGGRTVDGGGPPQSFTPPSLPQEQRQSLLPSPIDGIADEAWTRFVLAMRTASPGAVSASNSLGMFEMRPRRLADIGLIDASTLTGTRAASGRLVWVGEWVRPLSQKVFLETPALQYKAFAASMVKYVDGLRDGEINQPAEGVDDDMSLSGALAILHRCGPNGLVSWGRNNGTRFNDTVELYSKANGLF
jgi:hypothetical protein